MRSACGALLLALALAPFPARAATEACLLQVDGKTYVNKPCNVEREADGWVRVNTGADHSNKFFAYIAPDDGAATFTGWWNGSDGYRKAQTELGILTLSGDCWVNAHAKICARGGPKLSSGTSATGTAEAFVRKLYAPYLDVNHSKQPSPELEQFLEPSLASLWRQSGRKWKRLDSPGGPASGDWVCDCQDGDMSNLQLITIRADESDASLRVSFKIDGDERKIKYDLRFINRRWLIRDMTMEPRSQSLRRELVKDSRSAQ